MRIPQFRVAVYLALLLGAACLFSPFGWGFTHPPLSGVNFLASLGFFVLVTITGIRTMQAWWQARHVLRPLMLFLGAAFLATVVLLGGGSMSLQDTSAHYQWIDHMSVILIGLGILSGFALQEFVRGKVVGRTQCRLTEPNESGSQKP